MSRFDRINAIATAQDEDKELDDYDQEAMDAVHADLDTALGADGADGADDADDAPPVYKKDGVWYTREKVNGVEREVPFNAVLAKAQKIEAADQYLREAAEKKRAIDEMAQRTLQQPSSPDVAEDIKALGKAYTDAIVQGDDELAAELWERAFKATQAPKIDPNTVSQIVESKLTERQIAAERRDAVNRLRREHPDVFNDPDLFYQADMMTLRVERERPDLSPGEVIEEAVRRVKRVSAQNGGGDRAARKRAGMSVTGVGARRQQQQAAPQTVSDTINQLRVARGKPPIG